jgi:class 3 adenylate cyclase
MEFEPAIAAHRGGIFKLMGDGLLAEFASVVDVVDTQRGMAERNFGARGSAHRPDVGRPSIHPELMIRMLIVGYCFGIPRALRFVRTDSRSPPA